MRLTIGITDTKSGYGNYPLWIKGGDADIDVLKLTPAVADEIYRCDGIVLSGGVDTHPRFYNNERVNYPGTPDSFDELRDEFEMHVFRYARKKGIPVLAICRGMQLVNIALGGDLVQDIEEGGGNNHKRNGETDGMHEVSVKKGTLLHEVTGTDSGIVNSAHHQAVGTVAPELVVNAYSPDGIAEGTEWKDKAGKPFLLCVQWHPERLAQIQPLNPFAVNVREKFLENVRSKKAS